MEQELPTLLDHLRSPQIFDGLCPARSSAFCVVFCRSWSVLLTFYFELSVLLRRKDFDYSFDFFKFFFQSIKKLFSETICYVYIYIVIRIICLDKWIVFLDCGDEKFYDRQDSSLQLKTDSSDGKLQTSIHLIDWLIDWLIDCCLTCSGKYFTYIQYENKLNHD